MALLAAMIHKREHQVRDVIGFMDGICLNTECTSELLEQNAIYSGYHSDTMINNAFAYGPDGRVFFVQSIFLVAGMMDLFVLTFCLTLKPRLELTRFVLTQVFPDLVRLLMSL